MAEKMMPYALRMTLAVLANKPDDARSISAECVTAMTKELMGTWPHEHGVQLRDSIP